MSSELRLLRNRLPVDYQRAMPNLLFLPQARVTNEANNFFASNKNIEMDRVKSTIPTPKRSIPGWKWSPHDLTLTPYTIPGYLASKVTYDGRFALRKPSAL